MKLAVKRLSGTNNSLWLQSAPHIKMSPILLSISYCAIVFMLPESECVCL